MITENLEPHDPKSEALTTLPPTGFEFQDKSSVFQNY